MRFGVSLPHFGPAATPELVQAYCEAAERLGFDTVWVADHVIFPRKVASAHEFGEPIPTGGNPWPFLEPMVTMSWVAGITKNVKIGSHVCVLPLRNPVLNAKMLATLDVVSGGRLLYGAGVGWMAEEAAAMQVPWDDRGRRSDEHLQILITLWTSDDPHFEGNYYRIADVDFFPKPVQKPHPPLLIGGLSGAALRRVARFGDGWLATALEPEPLQQAFAQIRGYAREYGRDPDALSLWTSASLVVSDQPLSQKPGQLSGTPDQIRQSLSEIAAAGVQELCLNPRGRRDGTWKGHLERFAQEIMPDFKG